MVERLEGRSMTREETQKLLMAIGSIYPNFKPEDKTLTIDSWHWALEEYPAPAIKAALQIYIRTNNTGFAPSVSQLIGCMHAPSSNEQLTEGEAWALVKKAIQDGNYHSEERFNELPELVQRAVGDANMIQQWASTDSDEVNTVIMSNFQRTYKAMLFKQEFRDRISDPMYELVKGLADKVSGKNLIGEKK